MKKSIDIKCILCKKTKTILVKDRDYKKYQEGVESVQNCFPYLNAADRELLISNICSECFDNIFSKEDLGF